MQKASSFTFTPINSNRHTSCDADADAVAAGISCAGKTKSLARKSPLNVLNMNRKMIDDDKDDDFEFARVGKRRGSGRFADDDDDYYDDRERDSVGSARTGSKDAGTRRKYDDDYDEIDFDNDEEEYDEFDSDDEDEFDDDDDDDDDDYDEIIPNALLDQIDPDGAIDRLPELFADSKFWKDSAIWFLLGFVYLLNRFNNPMLNGIIDLDKVDFTQFYNQVPPPV